jgi:hypothetical protein
MKFTGFSNFIDKWKKISLQKIGLKKEKNIFDNNYSIIFAESFFITLQIKIISL